MASFILVQLLILAPVQVCAQNDSLIVNQALLKDSIPMASDSLILDSTKSSPIDEVIQYPATDSTVYDIQSQIVKMYNKAKVTYGDITLEADFIAFDFQKNEVTAYGKLDSLGNPYGRPIFSEGSQSFRCDTIRYNFNSKQGLISSVKTDDNESYVHAEKSKRHSNEEIHNLWGKYTTCNLDNPHYHFRFKKMIIVPDKKIITGPVFMKVGNVPTPLALPFGFFPNSNKQKAGILIPSYGESDQLGFYLINGGYYLPLGNHIDTKILGDIYSRGSWGLKNTTRYFNRYKYSGNFNLTFNSTLQGDVEVGTGIRTKTYRLVWNHRQDSKASVSRSFSARVDLGSTQKDRNNFSTNIDNYARNNSNSTVSYSKTWTKSSLSGTLKHNQNSFTGLYNFTLPSLNYSVNRFFLPMSFLRKNKVGQKWFEKIAVNYNSSLENKLRDVTEDDLQLDKFDKLNNKIISGIKHTVRLTTNMKAGPLTFAPNINYNQLWHLKRNEKIYNSDSLTYDNDTTGGFWVTDNINFGMSMNTKIYGLFQFKSKRLKAIRHVITPSVGFSYRPERDYNTGALEVDTLSFDAYNPYSLSVYNQSNNGETGAITMGLMNNLEMKIRDRKDTTGNGYKKVAILENLSIRSDYNLLADSLNLAPIRLTARTRLSKNVDLTYGSTFNPYEQDQNGISYNEYRWNNGKTPFQTNSNFALNVSFNGGTGKNNKPKPAINPIDDPELAEIERNREHFVDFNMPWSFSAKYTFNIRNTISDGVVIKDIQQGIRSTGDIRILEKWNIGYNGSYDLVTKDLTSLTLNLHWNLHCWEFIAGYTPIGTRRNYNIRLGVVAPVLQDLKLQTRGNIDDILLLF